MRKSKGMELLQKTAEIFDLPGEAAIGVPRVTCTGTDRVHIENHRGLLEYGKERIIANAAGMMIRITGKNLDIVAMSDMELVITGKVAAVEFVV